MNEKTKTEQLEESLKNSRKGMLKKKRIQTIIKKPRRCGLYTEREFYL